MNVVLVMFKEKERREFPLAGEETILGRRQDCSLRIPTKDVSRQHCAVRIKDEKVTAKDLGSSNGTYVNGKRIAEVALAPGDHLRLGPVTFVVQINGKPDRIKPEDIEAPHAQAAAGPAEDEEETFELGEEDFDIEDAMSALDDDDEDDMP